MNSTSKISISFLRTSTFRSATSTVTLPLTTSIAQPTISAFTASPSLPITSRQPISSTTFILGAVIGGLLMLLMLIILVYASSPYAFKQSQEKSAMDITTDPLSILTWTRTRRPRFVVGGIEGSRSGEDTESEEGSVSRSGSLETRESDGYIYVSDIGIMTPGCIFRVPSHVSIPGTPIGSQRASDLPTPPSSMSNKRTSMGDAFVQAGAYVRDIRKTRSFVHSSGVGNAPSRPLSASSVTGFVRVFSANGAARWGGGRGRSIDVVSCADMNVVAVGNRGGVDSMDLLYSNTSLDNSGRSMFADGGCGAAPTSLSRDPIKDAVRADGATSVWSQFSETRGDEAENSDEGQAETWVFPTMNRLPSLPPRLSPLFQGQPLPPFMQHSFFTMPYPQVLPPPSTHSLSSFRSLQTNRDDPTVIASSDVPVIDKAIDQRNSASFKVAGLGETFSLHRASGISSHSTAVNTLTSDVGYVGAAAG
ncbi:hypothetical protein BC829DRAFT_422190 [Chytridium lagenaria]|nr:hypothetical protein BC829DRAFT_422190 [Chytridium lagenaria]